MNEDMKQQYVDLDLPCFTIPFSSDLSKQGTLDRFLSQTLNVPLTKKVDGTAHLACIDDSNFVLTLDFTIKLFILYERIAYYISCILEGETGISKTATERSTLVALQSMESSLKIQSFTFDKSEGSCTE